MNIEERFKQVVENVLEERKISKAKLCKMTGVSYQTLLNIFNCKPSSTATMNRVMEALDLNMEIYPIVKL